MKNPTFPCLAALLALAAPAWAQVPAAPPPAKPATLFPFVLPWDDASPGTITDVSFLNAKPAGVHGFIVAKQGHFVEANTGSRIRFLGTNFAGKDAFPSHADARKVAARIAKLGINLVRLHHMDNSDWGQDASIWNYAYKDRQHLSAVQLNKLDYLVAQLKKNGVYVNINLHVSRRFSEADGFPASVGQIPTSFDKRVDEFDRRMIGLQKNYAHNLLLHVNPYTHLAYASDPAVAVVEINNENSLVGDPWAVLGADLGTLPQPFREELVSFWNTWLSRKYGTDARLQAAWTTGVTPLGPGLLSSASLWSVEHQGASQAALDRISQETPTPGSAAGIVVKVPQVDGTDWHVQVHQSGLDLKNDTIYTATFQAKADTARSLPVTLRLDQADWHTVGLDANAALSTDWKLFEYMFTAHDAVPNHCRLAFSLGGQTGTVWISELQIHPGADGAGLLAGQSLTTRTVDIPVSALKARHDDWIAFLADTERGYAGEMRGYLKNTLHVHANIICSQISWGGLTGLNREANMDFADNHAYWQHPAFPHKQWDPKDWNIGNTPMVSDLAAGNGGTLRDLAEYRVAGKPYTVSEYNHPAPSDYRAETLPELATFAAFQDWDAIYLFDYGPYGTGVQNDRINTYFGIGSDPAKTAFLPAAAMIFRGTDTLIDQPSAGIFSGPLNQAHLYLTPSAQSDRGAAAAWSRVFGEPDILKTALSVERVPEKQSGWHGFQSSFMPSGLDFTGLKTLTTPSGAQYQATNGGDCVAGYVGGQTVALGQDVYVFPAFGNNFASVTLTAMDRKPTQKSLKLLLTLVGKVENQGMGWNAARTSVGDQWGQGPTVAEGIPATVMLQTGGPRSVWALDSTGKPSQRVPAAYANGTLTFTVGPQYQTLWYAVERQEKREGNFLP